MSYTELETRVFNSILSICYEDYSTTVAEIATELGEKQATIKGAVGSLVKKNKVMVDFDQGRVNAETGKWGAHEIFPLFEGRDDWNGSFGCDVTSFEEWMSEAL